MEPHRLRTIARFMISASFLVMPLQGTAGAASGTFKANEACQIALADANVTRGSRVVLKAQLTPQPVFTLRLVEWTFTGGKGGARQTGKNLQTDIKLVDSSQQYTVTVTAFSQVAGIQCKTTAKVKVTPRPWQAQPTVKPDNEAGWGKLPLANDHVILGEERDRASDTSAIIIPSPTIPNRGWEDGYTVSKVDDPNGPNDGYYYLSFTSVRIDQETVINLWIKQGARAPDGAPSNWFQANVLCLGNPANFVTAAGNHENSGSGGASTGHFGLIHATEAMAGMDPQTAIEDNTDLAQAALIAATNNELSSIEGFLQASADEQFVTGNWPGAPGVAFWDPTVRPKSYSPCNQFMRAF